MHRIGFNGKKLLEAICFDGVKETVQSEPITFGEPDIRGLVNLKVLINNLIKEVKEKSDIVVPIQGYDLGMAIAGEKNAIYIGVIKEWDEYVGEVLKLAAKGNRYSMEKFKKAVSKYETEGMKLK